jgi:hypothetical protein
VSLFRNLKSYLIYIARNHRGLYLLLLLSFLPFIFFAVNAFLGVNILFSLWFAVNTFTAIFGIFLYLSNYFTFTAILLEILCLLSFALREEILGKRFYTLVSFWLICSVVVFMILREVARTDR